MDIISTGVFVLAIGWVLSQMVVTRRRLRSGQVVIPPLFAATLVFLLCILVVAALGASPLHLAAHLLAAQFDVSSGSATCINGTIATANAFLQSVGYAGPQSYSLTSAQASQAISLEVTLDNYTNDKQKAPQSLDDLVSAGYLKTLPVDPMTHSSSTWVPTIDDTLQRRPYLVEVGSGARQPSQSRIGICRYFLQRMTDLPHDGSCHLAQCHSLTDA